MEGRRDIKGEKEGVEQERRKERKKVLKERKNKNIIIIENYFKQTNKQKRKQACWPSQFCWCFLAVVSAGSLAQLFSVLIRILAASGPSLQRLLDPQVQVLTHLQAMGVHAWGLP